MEKTKNTPTVFSVVREMVTILERSVETPSGKATLAKLRHSTGQPLSRIVAIWPIVFEKLPEEFLGYRGDMTPEERVILTTLQLYAWQQQGQNESVNTDEKYKNMGDSLRALRKGTDTMAVDRRFNVMITAENFDELIYYLRQMIKLLKSKTEETVNYPQLANDLYWFLQGQEEKMRISWAEAYYKQKGEDSDGK